MAYAAALRTWIASNGGCARLMLMNRTTVLWLMST